MRFSERGLKILIFWFAVGMIVNACMEFYVWFTFNYLVPGWVPATTWLGTSIIILAYISANKKNQPSIDS